MVRRVINTALPIGIGCAFLVALAGGARAMEDGTCTYSEASGTCSSYDCGVGSDPHECVKHTDPTTHCDCVPKNLT
jgi:hypothetical protein